MNEPTGCSYSGLIIAMKPQNETIYKKPFPISFSHSLIDACLVWGLQIVARSSSLKIKREGVLNKVHLGALWENSVLHW